MNPGKERQLPTHPVVCKPYNQTQEEKLPPSLTRNNTPNFSETANGRPGGFDKSKLESPRFRGTDEPILKKAKSEVPSRSPSISSSNLIQLCDISTVPRRRCPPSMDDGGCYSSHDGGGLLSAPAKRSGVDWGSEEPGREGPSFAEWPHLPLWTARGRGGSDHSTSQKCRLDCGKNQSFFFPQVGKFLLLPVEAHMARPTMLLSDQSSQ